jgi:hypothetical protein
MLLIDQVPEGIKIEKRRREWRIAADDHQSRHLPNLIFHLVGLWYILLLETLLIIDFFRDWRYNSNSWIEFLLYGIQGLLFVWIAVEMLRSIRRLFRRGLNILHLALHPTSFTISTKTQKKSIRQEVNYQASHLQAVYCSLGMHQAGAETKALLLNLPAELYLRQAAQPTSAWGDFLREDQLLYLADLLEAFYLEGKVGEYVEVE